MRITTALPTLILTAGLLAGCTQGAMTTGRTVAAAPTTRMTTEQVAAATAVTRAPAPRPAARATPAQLDTTTPEQRAAAAQAAGHFDRSVLSVDDEIGLAVLERDEFIKPRTTPEGLGSLKLAFDALGAMGFDAVALAGGDERAELGRGL